MPSVEQAAESSATLPEFSLAGRIALVTGGGTWLGRQMALALADAGAHLVLVARRREPLEETAAMAATPAEVVCADLTDDTAFERLRTYASRVDILINNSASAPKQHWLEHTAADFRQTLEINVTAPFRLCQIFAPAMAARGWGRIINITSIYATVGVDVRRYPGSFDVPAYVASKHALLGLTRYLACRLGDTGVTVNALSPGVFPTGPRYSDTELASLRATLAEATPLRRVGGPDDLRAAVVFLASPGSRFVTGHNLIVDGGWTVW
jgi:NAD(P)-dependent dehydrogenase (short-subunit alcohol dehydrogenase family)